MNGAPRSALTLAVGILSVVAGCGASHGNATLAALRTAQDRESARLDDLRARVADMDARAAQARARAEFAECHAQLAQIDAHIAMQTAACNVAQAEHLKCQAENEAARAEGGFWGCVIGIGAAWLTGGSAVPMAMAGCGIGMAAGDSQTVDCSAPACLSELPTPEAAAAHLGLSQIPSCGGDLGLRLETDLGVGTGVPVQRVGSRGTTAAALGLRAGDVLLRIGEMEVRSTPDVDAAVSRLVPGQPTLVVVLRDERFVALGGVVSTITADGNDAGRAQLGVALASTSRVVRLPRGVIVADVHPGGPGARAGVRAGDRLAGVGSSRVMTEEDATAAIDRHAEPYVPLQLELLRNGVPVGVEIVPSAPSTSAAP